MVAHEHGHNLYMEERKGEGEFCASLKAVEMFKDPKLGRNLAKAWYRRWWIKEPIAETREYVEAFEKMIEE